MNRVIRANASDSRIVYSRRNWHADGSTISTFTSSANFSCLFRGLFHAQWIRPFLLFDKISDTAIPLQVLASRFTAA